MKNQLKPPARLPDYLIELTDQAARWLNNVKPLSEGQAMHNLGCDVVGFDALVEEALLTPKRQRDVARIIGEAAAFFYGRTDAHIGEPVYSELGKIFWLGDRIYDLREMIAHVVHKTTPTVSGGFHADPVQFEKDRKRMNTLTRKLRPELLLRGPVEGRTGTATKGVLSIKLYPRTEGILRTAAAAANVTVSDFVQELVENYTDPLLRGYVEQLKDTDHFENAQSLWNIIKVRNDKSACFVGSETANNKLGPNGPKYNPDALPDLSKARPDFNSLNTRVSSMLLEHRISQGELSELGDALFELQGQMRSKPESEHTKGEKDSFWKRYTDLRDMRNRAVHAEPKQEAGEKEETKAVA